jgi:hypothetical protein
MLKAINIYSVLFLLTYLVMYHGLYAVQEAGGGGMSGPLSSCQHVLYNMIYLHANYWQSKNAEAKCLYP